MQRVRRPERRGVCTIGCSPLGDGCHPRAHRDGGHHRADRAAPEHLRLATESERVGIQRVDFLRSELREALRLLGIPSWPGAGGEVAFREISVLEVKIFPKFEKDF